MDLKDKIKVMQHFADGGKVEYRYENNGWNPCLNPTWAFPPGTAIRDQSGIWQLITACTKNNLKAADWITPEKLMEYKFEYSTDQGKTWLPCYKEV